MQHIRRSHVTHRISSLIFVIALLVTAMVAPAYAQDQLAEVVLSPLNTIVEAGEEFTVEVHIIADETQVYDSAEAHINFDFNLLEVIDVTAGENFPFVLTPTGDEFDNSAGTVDLAVAWLPLGEPQPAGDNTLMIISFRAKDGVSGISPLNFTEVSVIGSDRDTRVLLAAEDLTNGVDNVDGAVTINEVVVIDSDGDGVADDDDQCPGVDDTIDVDSDGIPDCLDGLIDSDGDGVADDDDQCPGVDDTIDVDSDGIPDCLDDVIEDDTEAPNIVCPANITVEAGVGMTSAVVNYPAVTATDNSGSVNVEQIAGLASGSAFPLGTTTNTYRATDGSGNTAECSFDVTVNETQPDQGSIMIVKEVKPDGSNIGDDTFDLYLGNDLVLDDAVDNSTAGAISVDEGNYSVSELASNGSTDLSDYITDIVCMNGDAQMVGASSTTLLENIFVPAGDTITCTITNTLRFGTARVIKYNDLAGNGVFDEGSDAGLVDWEMTVLQNSIEIASTLTNSDGDAFFSLLAGDYVVCETLQANWVNTEPGGGENCIPFSITTGAVTTVYLGNMYVPPSAECDVTTRDPRNDLISSGISVDLSTGKATVTVSNISELCAYEVGMASYEMWTNANLNNQVLYGWSPNNPPSNIEETKTYLGGAANAIIVPPSGYVGIEVAIPQLCASQIDVFFDASELDMLYGYGAGDTGALNQVPLILPYFNSGEFGSYGNRYGADTPGRLLNSVKTSKQLPYCMEPEEPENNPPENQNPVTQTTPATEPEIIIEEDPPVDSDNDGIFDDEDACPTYVNDTLGDPCVDGDEDNDGVADSEDTCPTYANDTLGDPCVDGDEDNDGVADSEDTCPTYPNDSAGDPCIEGDGGDSSALEAKPEETPEPNP